MITISNTRAELARRELLYSADDDYICARLCARNRLYRHFAWNAAQCVEKYIKLLIVLQGKSAKFGHNFSVPFRDQIFYPNEEKFPLSINASDFTKVRSSLAKYSREKTLDFVERLEKIGAASVRYRSVSSTVLPYDMQKLDRLVFLLRRLCVPPPKEPNAAKEHEEHLKNDFFYTTATDWPTIIALDIEKDPKWTALTFENCANFPEKYNESKGWQFGAFDMSPRELLEVTETTNSADLNWLKDCLK